MWWQWDEANGTCFLACAGGALGWDGYGMMHGQGKSLAGLGGLWRAHSEQQCQSTEDGLLIPTDADACVFFGNALGLPTRLNA
jgi:hypothetical protein